jgi:hypothetical protein
MPQIPTDPASLKNSALLSLSEKELKAIIGMAMRRSTGLTLSQVNKAAANLRPFSKKEMLVALTLMITNQLLPGVSVTQLRADAQCSVCENDTRLEMAILWLFANYYQATAI